MSPIILWKQVLGLSLLLVAVVLCWMVYDFYQPLILTQLGFGNWVVAMAIFQGFLGGLVEPWVGVLSDRFAGKIGDRLPQITVGITLAGLIFVVTAVVLQVQIPPALRWMVPLLMTFWVIAMLIFRGPAIALLRQFAPTRELPVANGILTVVFGLAGAIGPLFLDLIQQLGMSLAFLLGAGLLVGGGLILWVSQPRLQLMAPALVATPMPTRIECATIVATGVGIGLLVNLLMRTAPIVLQPLLGWKSTYIVTLILLIGAIATLPMEEVSRRWGWSRALFTTASWVGLNLLVIHLGFPLLLLPVMIASVGISLGWLFVTQVPWALMAVAPDHAGFGVGLYFGGMGGATAIVSWLSLLHWLTMPGLLLGVLVGWSLVAGGTIGNFSLKKRHWCR
jgi:MFS family permease